MPPRLDDLRDPAIAVFFALAAAIAVEFSIEHGFGPALALDAGVHVAMVPVMWVRRRYPVAAAVAAYALLGGLALAFHVAPINLGVSPILFAAPLALMSVTRYGPNPVWGQAALLIGIVGSYASPATHLWGGASLWAMMVHALLLTGCYLWSAQQRSLVDRHAAELERQAERWALDAAHAAESERLLIAREVHDIVGHGLAVARVQAATALALGSPDQMRAALEAIKDLTGDALTDTRDLVEGLRDQPGPVGDLTRLPELADHARAAGFAVATRIPEAGVLAQWQEAWPARVRLTVVRVVQEALTNAVRHGAAPLECAVAADEREITVTVTNALVGDAIDPTERGGGHGLLGLQERVLQSGGSFTAEPREDRFVLTAIVPIPGGGYE